MIHQVFDVHPAVPQGATVFIRLRDLGGECDHTFEAGDEILRDHSHSKILALRLRADATGR
ncbi:hypothetical protein MSIM_33060 [Mycobacterium simiae]|nr:hypothetical protein MSIM_33060 [Mycobacterium simiae]